MRLPDSARAHVCLALTLAAVAGVLQLATASGAPAWEPFARTLWAAAVAGPLALALLHAPAASDGRPWLAQAAALLPALAVVGIADEWARTLQHMPAPEVAAAHVQLLLLHAGLFLLTLALALPALRRLDRGGQRAALLATAALALVAAVPALDGGVLLGLFVLEAFVVVGLARLPLAPRDWLRAAGAGLAVSLTGLGALLLGGATEAAGGTGLVLSDEAFLAGAPVILAFAALSFLGALVLAWGREPVATR